METKKCPKCSGELKHEGGHFHTCVHCARRYRLTSAGTFVERWGGAISVVLYPVIFAQKPQERAADIGNSLCRSALEGEKSIFRRMSSDQLKMIQSEISDELESPTQAVKEILRCHASEGDLREYLAAVAKILRNFLDDQQPH